MKKVVFKKIAYKPASHENFKNPGVFKKVMLTSKDFNPNGRVQMVNWAKLPRGENFQAHYHEDMDEVFIIVSGKVKIQIDHEDDILEKGDTVLVPMKSIHKMQNIGQVDVEYIVIGVSLGLGGKTIISSK